MAKFLIDESTGKKFFELMISEGFDAKYVGSELNSAIDEKVLEAAEKENRILITDDKDFGELIFRLGKPSSGVIFLRTRTFNSGKKFELLKQVLKIENLENKFIVVTEEVIRIREI